jgi:hypothetical protein
MAESSGRAHDGLGCAGERLDLGVAETLKDGCDGVVDRHAGGK